MARRIVLWLALLTTPFWESKAPQDWTPEELDTLLHDSPWAQMTEPQPAVQVYLASAAPIREGEAELARRGKRKPSEADPDYQDFLKEDAGRHIVLAIPYPNATALSDAAESRHMEEDCVMKVGRKKHHITGHFPPTPSDPVLRLIFPREVGPSDKSMIFELYLPGMPNPFRTAEFRIKEMTYKGKLEM